MDASLLYCSVGCGRTPHAVSWNRNGLLAFAADKSVALANSNEEILQVVGTLHGHSNRVNCVHWITCRSCDQMGVSTELVSGSSDKTIRVWRECGNQKFTCVSVLTVHTQPVTCLAATYTSHDTRVISGSSDSTVTIWLRGKDKDEFVIHQTLSFGRGFILCIDCYYITRNDITLLVCGGDDGNIHLYKQGLDNNYEIALSLSGHEDWIRDVQFTQEDNGDILLATCSQDTYIRLWRIAKTTATKDGDIELKLKGNQFSVYSGSIQIDYTVTLEAVLLGHDDWVYSIRWQPLQQREGSSPVQPMCLLSVSMDKTMILWRPDPDSGVWLEQVRVGDVGGNTLGLYGGLFAPGGDIILAHGYQGAFHIWKRVSGSDDSKESAELWQPLVAPSGHFGPVQDLCWEPFEGRYLLSVSGDQTTRLHSIWNRSQISWHELARPQIHGYDMQCIAMISPVQFTSGADEKVIRVFEAPQNFIENLSHISGFDVKGLSGLPLGASVPALGLSNKAVFTAGISDKDDEQPSSKNSFADHIPSFSPLDLTKPPIEEHLLQNTLWPETQKLYGHGYELYCVSASPDGKLIASACKASKPEHAAIRVWDTATWHQVSLLVHHSLTVTQLAFSHDGSKLLAVSRDRCWSLWNRSEDDKEKDLFTLITQMDKTSKAHTRIIWSCSWSPDDRCFATASRDKRVCVWSQHSVMQPGECDSDWRLAATPLELSHPVTAINFAMVPVSDNRYLAAMGLENGEILFSTFSLVDGVWSPVIKIHPFLSHTSTVHRLQWKPYKDPRDTQLVLASCSSDHSVRILQLNNYNVFDKK